MRVIMPAIINQAGQKFNVDKLDGVSRRHNPPDFGQGTPSALLHGLSTIPEKPVRPVITGDEATPTPVPALRRVLRDWFSMIAAEADGELPTPQQAQALFSEIRRLWDDTGPAFAEAVQRQEARDYYRRTGTCPLCGERGVLHDPDRRGEAAR